MSATPLQTTAAPLPSGGELRHARVRHAGDTPPEGFAWRKTPTATSVERAAGAEGQAGAPVGVGSPATAHTEGATAKQISPNKNHAAPLRYKTLPARAARPHFRYKTLPAHPFPPHVRYKTLPARASRPHFRYKTLPVHPKWLDLALFLYAGRVLYRCHRQEAEQGEFCTEREAELGLANRTPGPTRVEGAGGTGVEGAGGFRGTEPGRGASG